MRGPLKALGAAVALAIVSPTLQAQTQQGWSITQNGYAPWQASDKLMHFETGAIGGTFTSLALGVMGVRKDRIWLYSLLIGLSVGLAKEVWDRHHGGSPELMDALNTAAGFATPGLAFRIRF